MKQLILSPEIITAYDSLIFDMDGTLIDTMPAHEEAWRQTGAYFGYPLNGTLMYQLSGATTYTIATAIMQAANMPLDRLEEVTLKKRELGVKLVLEHATLLPCFDIVQAFQHAKPMAIGTGAHRSMTNLLVQKFQLQAYFDAIVTSDEVAAHKPAPDTFLCCAKLLGVEANRTLVFEDGDFGIEAAHAANMDVFDVRDNTLKKHKLA